jgi:Acyl-CoA synthetases (AMP-forming)/AMP-acid ligases II
MDRPWLNHYDPGVPHEIEIPDVPFTVILDQTVARYPQQTAVYFYGHRWTYRQLDRITNRFANALIGLRARPGDRVALLLPNCPQFVAAYFGAWKAGAVVTPVNPLYAPGEIAHHLNDSGAETLVVLSRFYPRVQAVRQETPLRHVVVTAIREYMGAPTRWLYALFNVKRET